MSDLYDAILNGQPAAASAAVQEALTEGASALDLLSNTWFRPWTKWAAPSNARNISFPSFCSPPAP